MHCSNVALTVDWHQWRACLGFALCVSDPLAAGGRDRFRSASLSGHQLGHAAQSSRACFALQRSTSLSLWGRPAAVCLRAWAVSGEIQRGKDTCMHTHMHLFKGYTVLTWFYCIAFPFSDKLISIHPAQMCHIKSIPVSCFGMFCNKKCR